MSSLYTFEPPPTLVTGIASPTLTNACMVALGMQIGRGAGDGDLIHIITTGLTFVIGLTAELPTYLSGWLFQALGRRSASMAYGPTLNGTKLDRLLGAVGRF
jgi:hypothetical protein